MIPVILGNALGNVALAHPGHSHFGSAEEEPSLFFLIWMGVILAMAAYGGWRLYRIMFAARQTEAEEDETPKQE